MRQIIKGIINRLSYTPSLEKLKRAACSVEKFKGYERLHFKNLDSSPLVFNNNQNIQEICELLKIDSIYIEGRNKESLIEAFKTLPELKDRSIKAFLGKGSFSSAFLLDNNKVLKSTINDIPDKNILARNLRQAASLFEAETYQIGAIGNRTFSIQEFGIPDVKEINFRFLTKRLRKLGYKFNTDWAEWQCAKFKDNRKGLLHKLNPFGMTKVVDLGCVRPPRNKNLEVLA